MEPIYIIILVNVVSIVSMIYESKPTILGTASLGVTLSTLRLLDHN